MRDEKKKRLAAKGWTVGTTKEFLRLTPEEGTFIELRLRLAEALREQRTRRRITQVGLARMLRSSQSRVAKMESGDPTVTLDLLIRSLLAMGASRKDIARVIGSKDSRSAA